MSSDDPNHLLPRAVRPFVLTALAGLLALALAAIAWRGPAILLDLAAAGSALWCF